MLARVLASELERESNERDLRRFNDMLRDQARGMGAVGRVARALAGSRDARTAVCRAACEVAGAPVAFLLEPSGREFVSTAMAGVDIAPVTIQPRPEAEYGGRAFTSRETYFVADARTHPALAAPLVEATGARSALFEPVLRDGQVAGVLIVIWRRRSRRCPTRSPACCGCSPRRPRWRSSTQELRARVGALALSRPADRPGDAPHVGRGAAARARPRPPRRVAADGRRARHRPPERVQHAARRARGRPADQGGRARAGAASCARSTLLARLEGAEFGLILPDCGLGEAVDVLDRVRARDPARPDRLGGRRALGRRGAGRAAARRAARTRSRPPRPAGRNMTIAAD